MPHPLINTLFLGLPEFTPLPLRVSKASRACNETNFRLLHSLHVIWMLQHQAMNVLICCRYVFHVCYYCTAQNRAVEAHQVMGNHAAFLTKYAGMFTLERVHHSISVMIWNFMCTNSCAHALSTLTYTSMHKYTLCIRESTRLSL